jgi:hypothetical protein
VAASFCTSLVERNWYKKRRALQRDVVELFGLLNSQGFTFETLFKFLRSVGRDLSGARPSRPRVVFSPAQPQGGICIPGIGRRSSVFYSGILSSAKRKH